MTSTGKYTLLAKLTALPEFEEALKRLPMGNGSKRIKKVVYIYFCITSGWMLPIKFTLLSLSIQKKHLKYFWG